MNEFRTEIDHFFYASDSSTQRIFISLKSIILHLSTYFQSFIVDLSSIRLQFPDIKPYFSGRHSFRHRGLAGAISITCPVTSNTFGGVWSRIQYDGRQRYLNDAHRYTFGASSKYFDHKICLISDVTMMPHYGLKWKISIPNRLLERGVTSVSATPNTYMYIVSFLRNIILELRRQQFPISWQCTLVSYCKITEKNDTIVNSNP